MKLNFKKVELANLSNDNKVLPQDMTPDNKVLPNELTPQVAGGGTVTLMSFNDCTTVYTCKQY